MPRKGIPDRWLDYSSCGKCIPQTQFVAFKVPLNPSLCHRLPSDQQWTTDAVFHQLPNLGMIIDLTNTTRYYSPEVFRARNVKHVKILCPGHGNIPSSHSMNMFFDAVSDFLNDSRHAGQVIGVHCTHGLNRTGYFICKYMINRMRFSPAQAIAAFNDARGHRIERQPYLDALARDLPKPAAECHLGSRYGSDSGAAGPQVLAGTRNMQSKDIDMRDDVSRLDQDLRFGTDGYLNRANRYKWEKDRTDSRTEDKRNGHPYETQTWTGSERPGTGQSGTHQIESKALATRHGTSVTEGRPWYDGTKHNTPVADSELYNKTPVAGGIPCGTPRYDSTNHNMQITDSKLHDKSPVPGSQQYSTPRYDGTKHGTAMGDNHQYATTLFSSTPAIDVEKYNTEMQGYSTHYGTPNDLLRYNTQKQYDTSQYDRTHPVMHSINTLDRDQQQCGTQPTDPQWYGTDQPISQPNVTQQYGTEVRDTSQQFGIDVCGTSGRHPFGTPLYASQQYGAGTDQYGTSYSRAQQFDSQLSNTQRYGTEQSDSGPFSLDSSTQNRYGIRGTTGRGQQRAAFPSSRQYSSEQSDAERCDLRFSGTERYSSEQNSVNQHLEERRWRSSNRGYGDSEYQDDLESRSSMRSGSARGHLHSWNGPQPMPEMVRGGTGYRRPYRRPRR